MVFYTWTILPIIGGVLCILMAAHILSRDSESCPNRFLAITLFLLAFWALNVGIVSNLVSDMELALMATKVQMACLCFAPFTLILMVYSFFKPIDRSQLMVLIVPLIMALIVISGPSPLYSDLSEWGVKVVYDKNLYIISASIAALSLIYMFTILYKLYRSPEITERTRRKFKIFIIGLIITSITSLVLETCSAFTSALPPLGSVGAAIGMSILTYSLLKSSGE